MMVRQVSRAIKKEYTKEGIPICLIPPCDKTPRQYQNKKYQNYCKDHNFLDLGEYNYWPELRLAVLRRDNHTCKKCGDNRRNIEKIKTSPWGRQFKESINNLEVDHIKEIAAGGDMWDKENLQTLCYSCHKKKTASFNSRKR